MMYHYNTVVGKSTSLKRSTKNFPSLYRSNSIKRTFFSKQLKHTTYPQKTTHSFSSSATTTSVIMKPWHYLWSTLFFLPLVFANSALVSRGKHDYSSMLVKNSPLDDPSVESYFIPGAKVFERFFEVPLGTHS